MSQQFRNILYASDRSGTFRWRRAWALASIDCVAQGLNLQTDYSQTPILDQNYYRGMNSITVQRWISDQQEQLFCKFFKPLMDANSGWVIYEIDDNMSDSCIPLFNRGRKAFEGEQVQGQIRRMLNAADFVTVTTDYIKQYYHDHYGVPLENIIAIPNFLPRYLFGDRYHPELKLQQFRKNKDKPRIGIVSSLSHFNVDNVHIDKNGKACRMEKQQDGSEKWFNEDHIEVSKDDISKITDDFDEIAQMVRDTINEFQWVCFGYCPPQIADLAQSGKVEVHGGVPIMNYPGVFDNLALQAVVAPIKRMEFNYCKSFIKYMECAALGVPCYATNCLPYDRIMPKDQLYNDSNDLKKKLLKLKNGSAKIYTDKIEKQWKWLNSPCHEGNYDIRNFWMEDNLNIHIDLYRLRQKALSISLANFSQQYDDKKKKETENTIFKNENGITITK